jgi:hypothetical protein
MEEDLIIEVWDVFKEYISDKNKETAANHFVDFLLGKDVDTNVLKGLVGYDPHLDDAIELVTQDDDEASDDDETDYDYGEDED